MYDDEVLGKDNNNEVTKNWGEVGHVISMGDGVAKIIGLTKVQAGEFVKFLTPNESGTKADEVTGIALNLENKTISVAIFGNDRLVRQGTEVHRVYVCFSVPTEKYY